MAADTVLHQSSSGYLLDKKHAFHQGLVTLRIPRRTSLHGPDVPICEHTVNMSDGVMTLPKAKLTFKIFLSARVVGGLEMRIINRCDHKVTCRLTYDGPGGYGQNSPLYVKPHGVWYEQLGPCQQSSVSWEVHLPLPKLRR